MRATAPILGLAALVLAGCQKAAEAPADRGLFGNPRGRYVGVGMYMPGELWKHLDAGPADHPAHATLDDDDEVIVVLDSATGELRQCGNLSGHCIAMNPWAAPLDPSRSAPARLLKHARELREEAEARAKAVDGQGRRK